MASLGVPSIAHWDASVDMTSPLGIGKTRTGITACETSADKSLVAP